MYIGSTGVKGLHHILWEIVDNSVDEAANGYADEITVKLWRDGSASVEDNGRGMPTDVNTKAKMSGVEVIFTKLHAGGKFDTANYAFSGGLHGVGASVTNALSKWLSVEVYRKNVFTMRFTQPLRRRAEKVALRRCRQPAGKHGRALRKARNIRTLYARQGSFRDGGVELRYGFEAA